MAQTAKTYRVYLIDGRFIDITAESYEQKENANSAFCRYVFKTAGEGASETFVKFVSVVAIVDLGAYSHHGSLSTKEQ